MVKMNFFFEMSFIGDDNSGLTGSHTSKKLSPENLRNSEKIMPYI